MLPLVVDVRVRAVLRESREAISRPLVILNFILGMEMLGYFSVMIFGVCGQRLEILDAVDSSRSV